jgi:hypothetical protein
VLRRTAEARRIRDALVIGAARDYSRTREVRTKVAQINVHTRARAVDDDTSPATARQQARERGANDSRCYRACSPAHTGSDAPLAA